MAGVDQELLEVSEEIGCRAGSEESLLDADGDNGLR